MNDVTGLVELPDPATHPLVHPLDLPQARRPFRTALLIGALTSPPVAALAAVIIWFASHNYLVPLLAGTAIIGFGPLASRVYREQAWAFIPRKRQDRQRPLPMSWELGSGLALALVLAVALLLVTFRLDQPDMSVQVREFTFGMGAAGRGGLQAGEPGVEVAVPDHRPSARAQDPVGLDQQAGRIGQRLQGVVAQHPIHRAGRDRQRFGQVATDQQPPAGTDPNGQLLEGDWSGAAVAILALVSDHSRRYVAAWREPLDSAPDKEEAIMPDPEPQRAAGKVLLHFLMSLDGFVAGPGHTMDFMDRTTVREGLHQEYIDTNGAILAGRDGYDSAIGDSRPYGGAWEGPIFVLTHYPEDARPAEGITILDCPVDEAVRIALEAAQGKNVEVFSPTIGAQLLHLGLIDELDIHVAPVLLGDGIRLYDAPGGRPIHLQRDGDDPTLTVDLRFRPIPSTSG